MHLRSDGMDKLSLGMYKPEAGLKRRAPIGLLPDPTPSPLSKDFVFQSKLASHIMDLPAH
ncbi:MAG: hypothetical protein AB8F78_07090 [Saprospiraceae bacterium]